MDRRDFFGVLAGAAIVPPMFPAQTHGYVSSGFVRAFGQGAAVRPSDNTKYWVGGTKDCMDRLFKVRAHP